MFAIKMQVGGFLPLIPKIYTLPLLLRKGEFHPPFLPSVCRVYRKLFFLWNNLNQYVILSCSTWLKVAKMFARKMQIGVFFALLPKIYTLPLLLREGVFHPSLKKLLLPWLWNDIPCPVLLKQSLKFPGARPLATLNQGPELGYRNGSVGRATERHLKYTFEPMFVSWRFVYLARGFFQLGKLVIQFHHSLRLWSVMPCMGESGWNLRLSAHCRRMERNISPNSA